LNLARTSLTQRESTIQTLETDRSSLVRQLGEAKRELLEIRHSLGYKVMRFYGSRIDRALPDGTSRGVFRDIVVASLRVLTEQGVRNFTRQAIDKIKRREFRISKPGQTRPFLVTIERPPST